MKRLISWRNPIVLLGISLLLAACGGGGGTQSGGQDTPPPTPPTVENMRVISIGDSIGNGFGLATPWPDRLAPLINRELVNNSVSNEQTSFGVSVIQNMIDQNDPSHVFILLGTNNALRGSVSGAISDLQTMVNIARDNNVIPIVGTLPALNPPAGGTVVFSGAAANNRANQINAGIRGLSNARIAPVAGMFSASNLVDGIHPNDMGQQQIAEAFATQF